MPAWIKKALGVVMDGVLPPSATGRALVGLSAALASLAAVPARAGAPPSRPNIVLILCDDLGFGDTGPSYQNQRAAKKDRSLPAFATPQLDRLAAEGVQLRNHYCPAPVCAPSRASLLLGVTQGHANVRDNQFDKALANNHTMATVLRRAGYATAAVGKYGLQGRADGGPPPPPDGRSESAGGSPASWPGYPTKRGFDFYYGYVRHVDGHFHYPKENGREVWENEREVSAALDLCYTTDLFTARAKKWIVEHRAAHPDQPFFLYLAYDTPHAVLALPPCAYPAGGGLHGGVQWTGRPGAMLNTAAGSMDGWYDPDVAAATWDDDRDPTTPEVPWPEVQKRYATAVRRIAAAVGDLVQLMKDLRVDRNTLIVFTSDNGPSRESYLKGRPYDPTFFAGYGDFTGIKRDTLEGGEREPTFARWPGVVPAGRVDRTPSGLWDWLATFAAVAGVPAPASSDGVSLLPALTGRGRQRPSNVYVEYFEGGRTPDYPQFPSLHRNRVRRQMQTVQAEGYVGVRYDVKSAADDFEIYDVEKDPAQAHDLAADPAFAGLQARMKARVLQLRRPDPSARRPYDDALVPPAPERPRREGGLVYRVYSGDWPWVPDPRNLRPLRQGTTAAIDARVCPARPGGVAFLGYFRAPADGEYTFHLASDGGATLFLHEARVIDDDFARTGEEASGTIRLAAGWHPLRLFYRHAAGDRRLVVAYEAPGRRRQPIPAAALAWDPPQ